MKTPAALALCAALAAAPAAPAAAKPASPDDLAANALAPRILVCSEIPGVTPETVTAFHAEAFPGWRKPQVQAGDASQAGWTRPLERRDERGRDEWGRTVPAGVVLIASDGTLGPELRACLDGLAAAGLPLQRQAEEAAGDLGKTLSEVLGISRPPGEGPIRALTRYARPGGWVAMIFMSSESPDYRARQALTKLFGLAPRVCARLEACPKD